MPPFRNPMTGRFETNPDEQTEAEKEKAEKEKLYAELADPNSPLYDPLLCLKNDVEYKAPEKKKGTSSTGPR